MKDVWHRIETALERIHPTLSEDLNGPADAATLARTEAALGIALPEDYRASALIHDGMGLYLVDHYRLLSLADLYTSRGSDGYTDNSMNALYAVNCLDHSDSIPTEQVPQHFADFEKASPTFGRSFAFSLSTCSAWPVKSGKVTKAMAATVLAGSLTLATVPAMDFSVPKPAQILAVPAADVASITVRASASVPTGRATSMITPVDVSFCGHA